MEELNGCSFQIKQNATTKKRSQIARRPRTASLQLRDRSPVASTFSQDDAIQVSSDDNTAGHNNPRTKEFNLSHCTLYSDESKVKRVKLKVGSVTHTIGVSSGGSSQTVSRNTESARSRPKLILQENSDEEFSPKDTALRGTSLKSSSHRGKEDSSRGKIADINAFGYQGEKFDQARKTKRQPKKHMLDEGFDEADEDDEIRYLKKLKFSKFATGSEDSDEESSKKVKRISRAYDASEDPVSSRSSKSSEKSRSERGSEGADYEDGTPTESKQDIGLTTRQRALLSSKGGGYISGASEIEFPNGLPPAPKKQKEKLSEADQLLKKTEAAQRRRMQAEKAARESEAEAIRKILGQDSNRKKKEDKIKKRIDDLAQEKATNAKMLASNTIRWVMGPAGTVVTFSNDLPSIFNTSPCNYPSPRENCAGPSCTNPYKYRDSKSKLPLCSLQCYKAVRENMQTQTIV